MKSIRTFASEERWEQLTQETRGRIVQVVYELETRKRLDARTIREYKDALVKLALRCDLQRPEEVARAVETIQNKTLLVTSMATYNHYCRVHHLPRAEFHVRIDRRRSLPILPPEKTLQASLLIPRLFKWKAYFRLLYETGARPSEPFSLTVADVDPDQQKVRLGTRKGSGDTLERELPISPLLAEQLRQLSKRKQPTDLVFHQYRDQTKPLEYDKAERIKNHVKKVLLETGHNVRGYRLHVYRHAFATRLYHATKDLALTSRSLGHRNLETTMIYVHLQPETVKRYDVQPCDVGDKPAIATYIAEGWELALQTPETVWFKRPRWVP